MVIEVSCPGCERLYRLSDDKAGGKFRCNDCREIVTVPEASTPAYENDFEESDTYSVQQSDDQDDFDQPYRPPRSASTPRRSRQERELPLASLGQRFLGALVDGLIGLVFVVPGIVLLGISGALDDGPGQQVDQIPAILGFVILIGGAIGLLVLQLYLLATRSQSIGKYIVKARIHDYNTGQPAGWVNTILLRLFVNQFIAGLPCIGPFYALVDILFIFGAEHRCVHDLLASTYVVDITEELYNEADRE